jgi:capsular polysaccharide biosynthesis protein
VENKEQTPVGGRQVTEAFQLLDLLIRFKNVLARMWLMLVAFSILAGGIFWYRAKQSFVPLYVSKAIFTVDAGYAPEDIFGTGAYYDQYAAKQLAKSFPMILSTDMMRDLVVQELEKGYINASVQATTVAESNMLVLTATGSSPQDAYDYLCAVIKCYPQVAIYMVDYPQVKVVTSPELPVKPYNVFKSTGAIVKGAGLGALISLMRVRILEKAYTKHHRAPALKVEFMPAATIQIDGELYDNLPFDVRVVSNQLKMYRK